VQSTYGSGGSRAELKARTRADIKAAALQQLTTGGPGAVSVNAIAKQVGLTGPAVYRHFASRDELLTELIVDAYRDLAAALRAAAEGGRLSPRTRLLAFVAAYRAWALAEPHRYQLLFAAPLPGYDPQTQPLVEAAQEAMDVLLGLLDPDPRPVTPRALGRQLGSWAASRGARVPPATALRAVRVWSRLHGLVSLELEGNFASMGVDPGLLLQVEVEELLGEPRAR